MKLVTVKHPVKLLIMGGRIDKKVAKSSSLFLDFREEMIKAFKSDLKRKGRIIIKDSMEVHNRLRLDTGDYELNISARTVYVGRKAILKYSGELEILLDTSKVLLPKVKNV